MAGSAGLWLRWSWRDLRQRWLLVGAIGLIVATGTGTYAGLGSTARWRTLSNDASFAALAMHDLRVSLPEGATVPEGRLAAVAASIPHASDVRAVVERLAVRTQVDASTPGAEVLVPALVVGAPADAAVDRLYASAGRLPGRGERGVALLEHRFAKHYALPSSGTLTLSGGARLRFVGVGASPQHFLVSEEGGPFAQGSLAVVYTALADAQALRGRPGAVNELVLVTAPGAAETVRRELAAAFATGLPESSVDITVKADEPAYRLLYEDIQNDQEFWNVIAFLVLAGAAFAAFNLTTRMVESQRREIGIGMALGVPRRRLAVRPVLVGAQIALLGVVAGVGVGRLLGVFLRDVFVTALPLPEWRTPFVLSAFARAALLGFAIPFVATAIPVVRALRVDPVDAIRTGHLTARAGRLVGIGSRVPLPGRTYRQMPVRNLLRTPRRTALTSLGIAAAIATLVGTIGLVDTFLHALDKGEREVARGAPDRLVVALDEFRATSSAEVRAVAASGAVTDVTPGLRLAGTLRHGETELDLLLDLVPFDHALWAPTLTAGSLEAVRGGGLVVSTKAATDLGVRVGGTVTLRHPVRTATGFARVDRQVRVAALHGGILRSIAYLDLSQANAFGLAGVTNVLDAQPAPGVGRDAAIRAVFTLPGVASVQAVASSMAEIRKALDQFFGVLYVVELVVLVLALLIAFNSASISVDERGREHATMLAFGLRPRTILGMTVVESVAAGAGGTLLGLGGGALIVRWVVRVQFDQTVPDLVATPYVALSTIVTAFLVGVLAVGLAPLLTARKVTRVDIPSRLRVIE